MSKATDEREKDEFGRIKNYPLGNYSEYAKDGKELNYLGYFKKHVGKIGQKDCFSYDWSANVFNDYISNYLETKILKCVNLDKPLSEFTVEDGEEYLSKIRNLKDKEEKQTFKRCRQLFWDVYSEAVKHGDFAEISVKETGVSGCPKTVCAPLYCGPESSNLKFLIAKRRHDYAVYRN